MHIVLKSNRGHRPGFGDLEIWEILILVFHHMFGSQKFGIKILRSKPESAAPVLADDIHNVIAITLLRLLHSLCTMIIGGDGQGPPFKDLKIPLQQFRRSHCGKNRITAFVHIVSNFHKQSARTAGELPYSCRTGTGVSIQLERRFDMRKYGELAW